jgi:hypothetical protein
LKGRESAPSRPRVPSPSRGGLGWGWVSLSARYFFLILTPTQSQAGTQANEPLSASVRTLLQNSIADRATPQSVFASPREERLWMDTLSRHLKRRIPDDDSRVDFLKTVHYEATRAGLEPLLVLGLIEVESDFRKYAVSSAGARGYMQVMPFWVREIGSKEQNLFHLRTNLRYGCTILRHYLDVEKGDLFRALGRYNGSLGRAEYPDRVRAAWGRYEKM